MNKGMVKVTKVSERHDAVVKYNIAEGETREGFALHMPVVGKSFGMDVKTRNGERLHRSSLFITSQVKEILEKSDKHIVFKTLNSIYRIDIMKKET